MTRPPTHVAIIMDGNGRWAQERGHARLEGHRAGAKTVREIVTHARELGVRYLTLYAFSSENWGRPGDEVEGLMELLAQYLIEERPTLLKNRIELSTIGATKKLPSIVRDLLDEVMGVTKGLDGMRLTLALSYGARDEIVRAVQQLVDDGVQVVDEKAIAARLDTRDMPDPDLLIRTSGEMRVSNFLLWQIAYAELYVTDVPWPAFTKDRFDEALAAYAKRQRRFGLTGAQVAPSQATASVSDEEA